MKKDVLNHETDTARMAVSQFPATQGDSKGGDDCMDGKINSTNMVKHANDGSAIDSPDRIVPIDSQTQLVVAYCRVSTDGQAGEDKFGIDSQKSLIQTYCDSHNMEITNWYIDEGESGVKENRPALGSLLFGELTNPPVSAVVVAKSDRIARNIKLYFYYMMLLEKKNIHLVSATEDVVNDDTGLGNVYKSLMLFVAEQERKNIMKRTMGGRRIKADRGGYSGGRAPMGYKVENGKLVINEDEAPVVRFVFSCKSKGINMLTTMHLLNEQGFKTRNGKEFVISTVQSIWNNERTYRGEYRYGQSDTWVKGEHEPILKD